MSKTTLHVVQVPLLERLVLEDLAYRRGVRVEEALVQLIRQEAIRETVQSDQTMMEENDGKTQPLPDQ